MSSLVLAGWCGTARSGSSAYPATSWSLSWRSVFERRGHQAGLLALAAEGDDQLLRAGPGLAERLVERLGLADQGDQAGRGGVVADLGTGVRRSRTAGCGFIGLDAFVHGLTRFRLGSPGLGSAWDWWRCDSIRVTSSVGASAESASSGCQA